MPTRRHAHTQTRIVKNKSNMSLLTNENACHTASPCHTKAIHICVAQFLSKTKSCARKPRFPSSGQSLLSSAHSVLISIFVVVIKILTKSNQGRKGFVSVYRSQSISDRNQDRSLKHRPRRFPAHHLVLSGWLSYLSHTDQAHLLGMALPTVG